MLKKHTRAIQTIALVLIELFLAETCVAAPGGAVLRYEEKRAQHISLKTLVFRTAYAEKKKAGVISEKGSSGNALAIYSHLCSSPLFRRSASTTRTWEGAVRLSTEIFTRLPGITSGNITLVDINHISSDEEWERFTEFQRRQLKVHPDSFELDNGVTLFALMVYEHKNASQCTLYLHLQQAARPAVSPMMEPGPEGFWSDIKEVVVDRVIVPGLLTFIGGLLGNYVGQRVRPDLTSGFVNAVGFMGGALISAVLVIWIHALVSLRKMSMEHADRERPEHEPEAMVVLLGMVVPFTILGIIGSVILGAVLFPSFTVLAAVILGFVGMFAGTSIGMVAVFWVWGLFSFRSVAKRSLQFIWKRIRPAPDTLQATSLPQGHVEQSLLQAL